MKIQHTARERFLAWLRRHKLPTIIISSIVVVLSAAAVVFFIFILPTLQQTGPTPEPEPPVSEETPPPPPPKYYSNLSGLEIASAGLNSAPVTCIMIENSPDARPHSGLDQASIVYEAIAEGGITRFLTVWQNATSALIGPVRSLRLYYLEWATPYDCAIAHVGGSADALYTIRNASNGYRDIDQFFNSGYYWRATDRYAPHNVYTSTGLMASINDKKGYTSSNPLTFPRTQTPAPVDPPTATTINLKISSQNYNPVYTYSPTTNSYLRAFQNGQPHMTTTTCTPAEGTNPQLKNCEQAQLSPSVVIAMLVEQRSVAESNGYIRQNITTTGTGTAHIFQNGQHLEATWSRPDIHAQFTFTDTAGQPITFTPGQIWLSAIPLTSGTVNWQ